MAWVAMVVGSEWDLSIDSFYTEWYLQCSGVGTVQKSA